MPEETIRTERVEREIVNQLSARGLTSCWAAAHPKTALEQTLRWSGDATKAYHCDGLFVPTTWTRKLVCEVFRSPRGADASDHNPVAAWVFGP